MAKSSPLVKDIISVEKLTEFLQWQFSWKPPVGNSRADSSITSSPFSRWFHGTARCTCMHGHGKSRWSGVEGIPRSIRVTITLNSVCPLVHRRAGTLAKPARARCARFHVTIDLHASPDHRDRGALINRSRLRSQVSFHEPSNTTVSSVSRSIVFIYNLSKISSSCQLFPLPFRPCLFLSITDPGFIHSPILENLEDN